MAATLALLGAGPARAEERGARERGAPPSRAAAVHPPEVKPEVAWDPRWPRFSTGEYVATGIFAATAFATLAIPPVEDRWRSINQFDNSVRGAFRIDGTAYRETSRDASDLLLTMLLNHLATDAILVTWWWHGRGSVAWELAMIDGEALALNAALNGLVAGFTSRERPYRAECAVPEEQQDRDCRDNKRFRSFFSGHSSTAFTAAGLTCSHHMHLPLYGGGAPDAFVCGAAFVAAAAVATLRVTSDQHFGTDALTGAAVGTLTGLGLPWLLHYRGGAPRPGDARPGGVSLRFVPGPLGGYVTGSF